MVDQILDIVALVFVFAAGVLSLAAGVGLLRFQDALSRLHAATKPQVLGLLLIIAAIAIEDRSFMTLFALTPAFVFQSLTAPVAAHMVGRAAYRTGQLDGVLVHDELAPAVERAHEEEGTDSSSQRPPREP